MTEEILKYQPTVHDSRKQRSFVLVALILNTLFFTISHSHESKKKEIKQKKNTISTNNI